MRKSADKSALRIRVEAIRHEHPKWGKEKITKILLREGTKTSISTVGRIISGLIKRGVIKNARFCNSPNYSYKPKPQRPYALRLKRGQKLIANAPGEAIQVDHMTVKMPFGVVKHFNAVCTVSRWNVADVYTNASARTASLFIDKLIKESPFPIQKIQVDGGSEFMSDFEYACQKNNIELSVLAPKSPKLNGNDQVQTHMRF